MQGNLALTGRSIAEPLPDCSIGNVVAEPKSVELPADNVLDHVIILIKRNVCAIERLAGLDEGAVAAEDPSRVEVRNRRRLVVSKNILKPDIFKSLNNLTSICIGHKRPILNINCRIPFKLLDLISLVRLRASLEVNLCQLNGS